MMTKQVDAQNKSEKRVPAMITEQAYDALQELTQLLKEEKGVRKMSFYEAASIAIVETAERKARAKQRREQRRQALAA